MAGTGAPETESIASMPAAVVEFKSPTTWQKDVTTNWNKHAKKVFQVRDYALLGHLKRSERGLFCEIIRAVVSAGRGRDSTESARRCQTLRSLPQHEKIGSGRVLL